MNHINNYHCKSIQMFECKYCKKKYKNKESLNRHTNKYRLAEIKHYIKQQKRIQEIKPNKYGICNDTKLLRMIYTMMESNQKNQ